MMVTRNSLMGVFAFVLCNTTFVQQTSSIAAAVVIRRLCVRRCRSAICRQPVALQCLISVPVCQFHPDDEVPDAGPGLCVWCAAGHGEVRACLWCTSHVGHQLAFESNLTF